MQKTATTELDITTRQLIPIGYCLIRKTGTKTLPPCCPPKYFAVAGCPCEAVIPDIDNIPIYPPKFVTVELGQKWDISSENANALFKLNEKIYSRINYTMLNYMSFEDADLVRHTFFNERNDVMLFGLGVLDSDILAQTEITRVSPFPSNGVLLGFDLYEIGDAFAEGEPRKKPDYTQISSMGLSCPLCCCDADGNIPKNLDVSVNSFGLYQNAADAVRVADWVNQNRLGESVWYLPVGFIRY